MDVEIEFVNNWTPRMKVVTFKLDEETLRRLDSLAKLKNLTRSELIRRAIELYLKIEESKLRPQPRVVRLHA